MKILIGITQRNFFEYTARAAKSALAHTPDSRVLVVDDASEQWPPRDAGRIAPAEFDALLAEYPQRLDLIRFSDNFGLTRSWNSIARRGLSDGFDYTVISNNDVVFTPGWFDAIRSALEGGYDVASPLSNAPGPTANGLQDVIRYLPAVAKYEASDDDARLAELAALLRPNVGRHVETRVNGFCWAARSSSWRKYAASDDGHDWGAFTLRNHFNSRGQRNPTPTMTLMEDEFQHRMYAAGGRSAACPGSFVFHYRSVWRGDKYKHGMWYRPESEPA